MGELVAGKTNISLISPISEKITGIVKSDNSGYWVIVHGWNNNEFYFFDINCNGVNPTPLVYQIGNVHTGGTDNVNAVGYLKANIEGNKLALVNRNVTGIETFDFDSATGEGRGTKMNEYLIEKEFKYET